MYSRLSLASELLCCSGDEWYHPARKANDIWTNNEDQLNCLTASAPARRSWWLALEERNSGQCQKHLCNDSQETAWLEVCKLWRAEPWCPRSGAMSWWEEVQSRVGVGVWRGLKSQLAYNSKQTPIVRHVLVVHNRFGNRFLCSSRMFI